MKQLAIYKPKHSKIGTISAVAVTTMLPVFAMAADLSAPDTSKIVQYIGYATAAIVAIGTAKLIPSAAIWLYSSLTSMIKRG